jgi:hypothetical protein
MKKKNNFVLPHLCCPICRDLGFYKYHTYLGAVLRIRDIFFPGSEFFHPRSRIRIRGKEISIFNQKCVLSSQKYNPGWPGRSSRIPDPDPGVKKSPDPGSATQFRSTGQLSLNYVTTLSKMA